jgi:ADP-ribose pyrophosphatase YjhB (NUDIX family)
MPQRLNGISVTSWSPPTNRSEWARLAEETPFYEPTFDAKGLKPAAGAVVVESDGRVWLVAPTNGSVRYQNTFPKGTVDEPLSLKATALKEVFEESGLRVELFEHLIDVTRSSSRTRYYLARRVGGSPADMGWESQCARLVPLESMKGLLNRREDHEVVERLVDRKDDWAAWFSRGSVERRRQ